MSAARFTPRQLEAFVAAAELNNFTLVGRRLNLTPSAISNLITELEAVLGFAVFERTTRRVSLTLDGREFLPAAMAVQRQLQQAALRAADIRERSFDVVRIAAPLAVAAAILPPLIAKHRAARPRSSVRILDTGVEWLVDRIAAGEADLALGPDRRVGPEVVCAPLFPSPWVVWLSPAHPLAAQPELRWRDLRETVVVAAGRDHEQSVAPRLEAAGEALPDRVEVVANVSTALGLAAAQLGVSFSPAYVRPLAEPLGLVMRRIREPEVVRHMSLYAPADGRLSAAGEAFRAHLEHQLASGS